MQDSGNLSQLLRRADEASPAGSPTVDVARCRRIAARRQTARAACVGVVTAAGLAVGCFLAIYGSGPERDGVASGSSSGAMVASQTEGDRSDAPSPEQPASDELTSLAHAMQASRDEARLIERTLELHRSRARLRALRQRLSQLEAEAALAARLRLEEETHRTAAISLDYAVRLASEANEPLLAAAEYRNIVRRYPDTRWATAAAEALARLP